MKMAKSALGIGYSFGGPSASRYIEPEPIAQEDLDALRETIRELVLRHGNIVIETLSWGVLDAQAERAKLGDKLSPAERPVPAPPRRSEGRSRARRPALRRRSLTTPRRPSRAPRRKAAGK
jgi:hypothetical protein